ncbi:hypothetical protein B0H17DRAFT_1154357 [Mycena rosella]|uniref:Uncharacterized protein n=1 Tax=Mycena rosella TaxID=1033263 RepID=A0AAD7F9B5_MYCRO|nr:hypothetical protein B0H17DRAFT_1154357 [Mycena rosella]
MTLRQLFIQLRRRAVARDAASQRTPYPAGPAKALVLAFAGGAYLLPPRAAHIYSPAAGGAAYAFGAGAYSGTPNFCNSMIACSCVIPLPIAGVIPAPVGAAACGLERSGLCSGSRGLVCARVSKRLGQNGRRQHTWTPPPAQPNPAPPHRKPLHLLNRALRVHPAHKLHEFVVLSHRHLDLQTSVHQRRHPRRKSTENAHNESSALQGLLITALKRLVTEKSALLGVSTQMFVQAPERFVKKNIWHTCHKMKLCPYPGAPYTQAYDPVVLESERSIYHLLRQHVPPGSPTFHQYLDAPPASALDLGCGMGLWLMDTARTWRTIRACTACSSPPATRPRPSTTPPRCSLASCPSGSLEFKKCSSEAPQLDFEPIHRPFSGVEHLVISILSLGLLPTVDVAVDDAKMPLTPVPPRASVAVVEGMTPMGTAPELTLSASSMSIHPAFTADSSGLWSMQCTASLDQRVFMHAPEPLWAAAADIGGCAAGACARVLQGRTVCVEWPTSFHLKLTLVELAELAEEWLRASGRGLQAWMVMVEWEKEEREGKNREKDRESVPKEAQRVVRRQLMLFKSPEESDEEEWDEEEVGVPSPAPVLESMVTPLAKGALTWVPPSKWDAPPGVVRSASFEGAVAPSPSSKTVTATESTKTVTTAASTKTLMQLAPPRTESPQLPTPTPTPTPASAPPPCTTRRCTRTAARPPSRRGVRMVQRELHGALNINEGMRQSYSASLKGDKAVDPEG